MINYIINQNYLEEKWISSVTLLAQSASDTNTAYEEIEIEEGQVRFVLPIDKSKVEDKISKKMPVFYNEVMVLNRDLTILMVKIYSTFLGRNITFMDTMAASGIRSMRLLKETDVCEKLFINDLNPLAVQYIKKNMQLNGISADKYQIFTEEAKFFMERFHYIEKSGREKGHNYCDIIDVDPFGTPSQYISSALQSIELGGLLCVTATDTPVLFGIRKEQCVRKYITKPIKTEYIKEMGTRILLYFIMKIAHIYELYIEPVLSLSSDHFIRVYVIIRKGIGGVNKNISECGYYLHCNACGWRDIEKFQISEKEKTHCNCPKCNGGLIKSGLMWFGQLHSAEYQQALWDELNRYTNKTLKSYNKIKKFLELSRDEDKYSPYYYSIPKITDSLNLTQPNFEELFSRIRDAGYLISRTHFDPNAIKTNADLDTIKNIITDYGTHHSNPN